MTPDFGHVIIQSVNNQEPADISSNPTADLDKEIREIIPTQEERGLLPRLMNFLAGLGLGEQFVRIGTHVLAVTVFALVVWIMHGFYAGIISGGTPNAYAAGDSAAPPPLSAADIPLTMDLLNNGITRETYIHTTIPSRPRIDVVKYIVQPGDTVFGIAEKFSLKPSTILFGNFTMLNDNPHSLRPDQVLNILPVDGTYYEWNVTDTLTGVAGFFGVDPDIIINYPGNHLDPETVEDPSQPIIAAGTWLIIPGGKREFTSLMNAPLNVTRENPAVARIMGEGACSPVSGGLVGFGTFVWPTNLHYLSGYDYSPETNHFGIDLAGQTGDAIYATDAGVIVYAGWNAYGYGNTVMIDHGNGWQSLYAHLSAINVVCGQSVGQGEVIAAMGSTGNSTGSHLHFELMSTVYGKVDPKLYLP